VICIKHVCDFFDSEQSKKRRVQMTGVTGFVNSLRQILINFSTKSSALSAGCAEPVLTDR
jgi:hypothetical protein